MIVVVAALKGGVGKTTTSVYLSGLAAASRRPTTLVDADPQASAADWLESADEEGFLGGVTLAEAPTERLLTKALSAIEEDEVAVVDTPPGDERLLGRALELADVVIIPTRIGGVETARVEAVLSMMPKRTPRGLVISSARTYTRDYQEVVDWWAEQDVPVWGSIPERVSIASGPESELAWDGIEAYRGVWRRVLRAARG
ncbi:MAG: chromosome partitioning protein [Actinomycetota bacterium]|nr:chromosome partitioning protein [Actinomycetota bacterium]